MDDREKIKSKLDIVDFIGSYVQLKKTGRNFTALCPFHSERSPSFIVSPERQIWHCFGCGKGGDIFTFVMEYDRMDFPESLRALADRAGIKLSGNTFTTEYEKKKDRIYNLNTLAAQYYQYLLLKHPVGKHALLYLTETRKVPRALIETFRIGYAPNNFHALTDYLVKKKQYSPQELVDAGLANSKNGRTYDFFRHRIIFPLTNSRGEILAFSGRALDNKTLPKYVNTRETAVYKKGDTLFALDLALEEMKKGKKVIVTEGEFDVISAFHEGITNIVAIKGTALTESQIKILKRYTEKILFCLDNDPAGTEAQRRSIALIEKWGILASVIRLPRGKDVDELLKESPSEFKKAIKNDQSIYDFVIESTAKELDTTSIEGKRVMTERVLPFLLSIQNEVIKEHYLKKLASLLETSYESLLRQGQKLTIPVQEKNEQEIVRQKRSREELTEHYLLSLILQAETPKEYCVFTSEILSSVSLSVTAYNKLFTHLKSFCNQSLEFSVQEFTSILPKELLPTLDDCYLTPLPRFKTSDEYRAEVEKAAREAKVLSVKVKLRELSSEMRSLDTEGSSSNLELLQAEFKRLTELLR